uniref:Calcineurin-like phosphoesterase n=1 Tax=Candidatus Kentrum sp. MB TaxID=2138164 RepID=A0A451B9S8_9GAMM|nr:MAG: hypothetical protein BECKMB1821I_GA0114274_101336 [Candidatus Kentron sp. MB]VFK75040.1 MAG: hypothetical protein BECKMB1821H_GA0114242_101436 [Candidatus Kentron sp. MB]
MAAENHLIHILHLSDPHLADEEFANICRMQLETDLRRELGIKQLEYLVISGDLT